MKLTDHFTLEEMLASEIADQKGIDNSQPPPQVIDNLRLTATHMETVRKILGGMPIKITSGWRCLTLNKAAGGSATSAHVDGLAVDFVCPQFGTPKQICNAIVALKNMVPFDQLIYEGGWVHVSFDRENPRRQTLTAVRSGGKKKYFSGIIDNK